jgi:hypothetical protein
MLAPGHGGKRDLHRDQSGSSRAAWSPRLKSFLPPTSSRARRAGTNI